MIAGSEFNSAALLDKLAHSWRPEALISLDIWEIWQGNNRAIPSEVVCFCGGTTSAAFLLLITEQSDRWG